VTLAHLDLIHRRFLSGGGILLVRLVFATAAGVIFSNLNEDPCRHAAQED
jgi:hypothetical protein